MSSEFRLACCLALLLAAAVTFAQPAASSAELAISEKDPLPKSSLWLPYSYRLSASGGSTPYHWRMLSGSLPRGIQLTDFGELVGVADESGTFDFTALLTDNANPSHQAKKTLTLTVETPLTADWQRKPAVNGQRIEGSIKVSNRTGRDFDLTVIVLAVNDIGRATAIGYQHFALKQNVRDFHIPFGETLSPGNYVVNVDVVGEEPTSQRIFRTRLVTEKQQITQGP